MRMLPSHYAQVRPAQIKKVVAEVAHISPPMKGLNLSSKLTTGDPMTAPILTNFVVDDDRITCRPGFRKLSTVPGNPPVERLIPFYGAVPAMAAAANNVMYDIVDASVIKSGFTGNDWSWCAFSNLGEKDYTVLCNGLDGVWSWDGGLTTVDPGAVTVTSLTNTNPARCTVAAADIAKFVNGMTVLISGATGAMSVANGSKIITNVGAPANTFTLIGVDCSAGSAPQTTGVTANPPATAGFAKETIAVPTAHPWVIPDHFAIVVPHMHRLFFADTANLALYYLPLFQKNATDTSGTGALGVLPLNALFRRGGTIRAMASWTVEGGVGTNDQLCVFTSNGECAIFQGTNPDDAANWGLTGVFRFDAPMNKHSVVNYGGELWVLISTGMVPLSQLIKAESEQLGQVDKAVISFFLNDAISYRSEPGWQLFLNPSSNRVFCNVPQGSANAYVQMVRHMPRPVWSKYQDVPARCWGWIDPYVYFGDDKGNVFQMHPSFQSDDGKAIKVDVQPAWSLFKTPVNKQFKMIRTYTISDAYLAVMVDMKVDYDQREPQNRPDVTFTNEGSEWDIAPWDTSDWARGVAPVVLWNGCTGSGRVGAPRLIANVINCTFSITGWDVIFEKGKAL